MTDTDKRRIAQTTQSVYERNAAKFDRERPKKLHEKPWLTRFQALLPEKAHILDVGCGAGEPVARYFIEEGYRVTGVDFSQPMLDIASERFPQSRWLLNDMRHLQLNETFDGIIGWHSFFHLTPNEQRDTLARLCEHLNPGGALMLTVGPQAGEVLGRVGDDPVYHSSLSPQEYETILLHHHLRMVAFVCEDPECDGSTILLSQKAVD